MSEFKPGKSVMQNKLIRLFLGKRPTLYFPGLNTVFGLQLGLLLSQLAYWHGRNKDKNGWIWKTAKELQKETGLSLANQKTAIKNGKKLDVLEIAYFKVPRRRHYRVNWERVAEIVELSAPAHDLKVSKKLMEMSGTKPTNSKNTQETSSKIGHSENQLGSILSKLHPSFLRKRSKND